MTSMTLHPPFHYLESAVVKFHLPFPIFISIISGKSYNNYDDKFKFYCNSSVCSCHLLFHIDWTHCRDFSVCFAVEKENTAIYSTC